MKPVLKGLFAVVFAAAFTMLGMKLKAAQLEREGFLKPIEVVRLYTGDDGESHVERIQVPIATRGRTGGLSEPVEVSQLLFRRTTPEYFVDWHNAPRRQYVVTLSGRGEVELGDGTKVALAPGTILLAEDTTGHGHITRALGTEDRISLFIPLAEQ